MRDRPPSIKLVGDPASGRAGPDGPVRSVQAAELEVPDSFLDQAWTEANLERLAHAYWKYLERVSLHVLRIRYTPDSRTVILLSRRLPLLRFHAPHYLTTAAVGAVTWPIERGVLVSPSGRDSGFLRISIRRLASADTSVGMTRVRVESEVANFYPGLRRSGWLARVSAWVYNRTQLRAHVFVTRGFLRSLARLELSPPRE